MQDQYPEIRARVLRNLKFVRKNRGLSFSQMGAILGLTKQGAHNLETGRTNISLQQLCTLSDHFGIPLCDMLSRELFPGG